MVSLINDSCFLAIGCKSESMKFEIRSIGPPLLETIGLPTGSLVYVFVSVYRIPVFLVGSGFDLAI